jgi:hypothetical protein
MRIVTRPGPPRLRINPPKVRGLLTLAACGYLQGCATFYPVETTPEAISESVAPGDTVRITTTDGEEVTVLVRSTTGFQITGREKNMPASDVLQIGLERIETLEVERPNLRKAMLTTFVPAVIAAVVICSRSDCETDAAVIVTFEP